MRLFDRSLGVFFILSVIATTFFVGQRAGVLVFSSISFLFSFLGMLFRKEISLNIFGKAVFLQGVSFRIYCVVLMLLSCAIFLKAFHR
jgi:hypothetical protein